MELTLARFGSEEVEIDPNTLIAFPNGMPGFEDCKRFKLFHSGDSPTIFWLQSIDDLSVVFSLADPDLLKASYELTLTDEEQSALRVEAGDELNIAVILSQQEDNNLNAQNAILAHFRSPIVFNVTKQIGLQKLLSEAELPIQG